MRTAINLMPHAYLRQQMVRRRAIQWGTTICVVLLFGWAWHWYERHEDVVLAQQLEGLAREHAPIQAMLRQLADMRRQLAELQQQEAVARELEHQRGALALLGAVSQAVRQAEGRLRVTKLELTDFQSVVGGSSDPARRGTVGRPATTAGGAATTVGGLRLTGVSLDNPAVGELLDGLQDSGVFSQVELLHSKERQGGDVPLRDYEIRCEF